MTAARTIGKYQLQKELGRGAMGVVYAAVEPASGRQVAIKTIRLDLLDSAERNEIVQRFKREAQAAGQLRHPNIVAVHEYDEDGPLAYIAMELIDGQELKAMLDAGHRFDLASVRRLIGQILSALETSHRAGIVHRDIKPANIFVLADGSIKVADFGVARIASSELTQVGSVLGTPSYMSPEQFKGLPVDGRSDLFSAGVVLYQLLTGEKPFTGKAAMAIMNKVIGEMPPPPSTLNPQLPPALDAVVAKALAKLPEERFQTAREFAAALVAALPQTRAVEAAATVAPTPAPSAGAAAAEPAPAVVARPASVAQPASTPHAAAKSRPAAQSEPARASSSGGLWVAVAAVALAVAGGIVWFVQRAG